MRRKIARVALSVLLRILALEVAWRFYVANFGSEAKRALQLA